jgi:hypothetical protein
MVRQTPAASSLLNIAPPRSTGNPSLERPFSNLFHAIEVLKICRQKNNVWPALQRALNFPQHYWVGSLYPPFAHHAGKVSWDSQPAGFGQVNSLFEVIEPGLLSLSFRSWNIMGERTENLDLMSISAERRNEHSDSQRRECREIVQIDNEDAPANVVFERTPFFSICARLPCWPERPR